MFDEVRITNERLISGSGLAIAGLILNKTKLKERLKATKLKDNAMPDIQNGDVAYTYLGLLCQGKSDCDAVREMHADPEFYQIALGIDNIPSSETLRQRMDEVCGIWRNIILEENIHMLIVQKPTLTPCFGTKYIPLDIDVSPFDSSKTKKEGVSRTKEYHALIKGLTDTRLSLPILATKAILSILNCETAAIIVRKTRRRF